MSSPGDSPDQIKERIKPILDQVAVEGLKAWLRSIDLYNSAQSRAVLTDWVVKCIAAGKLAEAALEAALIGFEEASDMRIYMFRLDELPSTSLGSSWLKGRLQAHEIGIAETRSFAGQKIKPMSPVYGQVEGGTLRVKWAEQQESRKLDNTSVNVITKHVVKRIVLTADLKAKTAELRLNPPENYHAYEDESGRPTANTYYRAYIKKAQDLLGCKLMPLELRPVVKKLVEEEDPRVVRIHIDNHTNQTNTRTKTNSSRADVRDDPDWRLSYEKNGHSWAWDAQSFYWLPKVSSGFLNRELFSHIDALEGFIKVNADCSDEEVMYVVSQIRAR
jgi:hypothetical protein